MAARVRETTLDREIERLETFVRRMERRYETSSKDMLAAIRHERAKETAEIATWMVRHRALQRLRALRRNGATSGTRTRTTGTSTTGG